MNRYSNYCGTWIRHGSWYPDKKVRFFDRNKARFDGTEPHDEIVVAEGGTTAHLHGDILHYAYYTTEEHLQKVNKYSTLQAQDMYQRGRKASWIKLLLSPWATFISGFIFKRGFLDGYTGLAIALLSATYTYLKYFKCATKLSHTRTTVTTVNYTTIVFNAAVKMVQCNFLAVLFLIKNHRAHTMN